MSKIIGTKIIINSSRKIIINPSRIMNSPRAEKIAGLLNDIPGYSKSWNFIGGMLVNLKSEIPEEKPSSLIQKI